MVVDLIILAFMFLGKLGVKANVDDIGKKRLSVLVLEIGFLSSTLYMINIHILPSKLFFSEHKDLPRQQSFLNC